MSRPTFISSRGDRNRAAASGDLDSRITVLLDRFCEIAKGIYEWSGLPKDAPVGYIEECIFWYGGAGIEDSPTYGKIIFPARLAIQDFYGRPKTWTPATVHGGGGDGDLMKPQDTPCLWFSEGSTAERLLPFVEPLARAIGALNTNLTAMNTPVLLKGTTGGEIDAALNRCTMNDAEVFIPTLSGNSMIEVLDLKATDHTGSLIDSIKAMYSQCLSVLHLTAYGMNKDSGISNAETISVSQEVMVSSDYGLKVREDYAKKVGLSVKISEGYARPYEGTAQDVTPDDVSGRDPSYTGIDRCESRTDSKS